MERKFLESLGIEKGIADQIMAENGNDIENTKKSVNKDLEAEKEKNTSLQNSLDEANKKIESFKDIDPAKMAQEIETYKKEAELARQDRDKIEKNSAAKDLLRKAGISDDLSLKAILEEFNKKDLKYDNDNFIGATEVIEGLKTQYPKHFEAEVKTPEVNPEDPKKDAYNLGGNEKNPPAEKMTTAELLYGKK